MTSDKRVPMTGSPRACHCWMIRALANLTAEHRVGHRSRQCHRARKAGKAIGPSSCAGSGSQPYAPVPLRSPQPLTTSRADRQKATSNAPRWVAPVARPGPARSMAKRSRAVAGSLASCTTASFTFAERLNTWRRWPHSACANACRKCHAVLFRNTHIETA